MGFFDSLLEMLGFTSKTTPTTKKVKNKTKQQTTLFEQRDDFQLYASRKYVSIFEVAAS